ncbi:hypothetical protein [Streptomyces avermitilis]|uniref:hypothetical protein n=1 Tax=Streptomyces avermitilis TaxID=33903 RepID=UPI003809524C
MVNHLVVSVEVCQCLMEFGDCSDVAGEVSIQEIAVTGSAKQPRSGSRVAESAKRFNDIDTSPAGDALGQPEQGLDSPCLPLECVRRQRPEAVGKQPDRLNQRNVVDCAHGSEQGKSNGDRASSVPYRTNQRPVRQTRSLPARSAAAATCPFW